MKQTNYKLCGLLITLLGAICFSTKAILVRLAYFHTPVDTISLLALRMLFALPFYVWIAFYYTKKKSNIRFTNKQWMHIVLIGIMGYYLSSLLDFLGLQYIGAGLERIILFAYPTLVVLLNSTINKKQVSTPQKWALILSYLGIALAFAGDIKWGLGSHLWLGAALVFGCAFTYAIYVFGSGELISKVGSVKFTSYAMLAATAAVLLHYVLAKQAVMPLLHYPISVYGYALLMAIVATVVPSFLMSEGLKRLGSNNVAIVSAIGPLATVVQAYFLLNEPFGWQQAMGTALVILGVIILGGRLGKVQAAAAEV